MKIFSLFILLLHFTFHSIAYSKPLETALTQLDIPFMLVDDPNNKPLVFFPYTSIADDGNDAFLYSLRSIGAVEQPFLISKYEITAAQYCSFLNAVACYKDPHHLYKKEMTEDPYVASITRTIYQNEAQETLFFYEPVENRGSLPITYVTLHDAERFCNWLENGAPTRDRDPLFLQACTEEGAYLFSTMDSSTREIATLNPNAHYYIPSENQWFKAAYYKGEGRGYWRYPTAHDAAPNNGEGDVTNQANYRTMATGWTTRETNPSITPVDRFYQSASHYGVCDMGGNVAEWTSTLEESSQRYAGMLEPHIVRGGSWQSAYSLYTNNELMALSIPQVYNGLTANNMIGFRIVALALESDEHETSRSIDHCSESHHEILSSVLWTTVRGLLFGCPRTMIELIFKYFGYNAATVLGVASTSEASFSVMAAIILLDLAGFVAVMGGIMLLGNLIPWSSLAAYFTRTGVSSQPAIPTPITPQHTQDTITSKETVTQALWSFLKSLFGCGMCILTAVTSSLKLILQRCGMSGAFLESIQNFFENLRLVELNEYFPALATFLPQGLLYNIVPVILELGFLGLFLFGCYEFLYYWPAIQDSLAQLWYGYVHCSGRSALDIPSVIY